MTAPPLGDADLLAGTRYRTLGPLASGGMGQVLLAEHIVLGKQVVVKILHELLAERDDMVDRMRIEAQALARLSHPNLVDVLDFGTTRDRRPFIVMERLQGHTLRQELDARGPLPVVFAVDIVRQILAGLGVVHAVGLVHRDIKPDNVFLCGTNRERPLVKLIDLGIAKVLATRDGRAPDPLCIETQIGRTVGTPRFFSPEQARGQAVDARSDLYATALVLYVLVAGRGPFEQHTRLGSVMRAHISEEPPPPSAYAPQPIPAALDRAILQALSKDPDHRFADAISFSEALATAVAAAAGPDDAASWSRDHVPAVARAVLPSGPGLSPARPSVLLATAAALVGFLASIAVASLVMRAMAYR